MKDDNAKVINKQLSYTVYTLYSPDSGMFFSEIGPTPLFPESMIFQSAAAAIAEMQRLRQTGYLPELVEVDVRCNYQWDQTKNLSVVLITEYGMSITGDGVVSERPDCSGDV